jgi:phage-related minor tail protein
MKRQSAAEQALAKQVRTIDENIHILESARDKLTNQIFGMNDVKLQLLTEINTLRAKRMSEAQKS